MKFNIDKIVLIFFILFSAFIIYQLVLKLLGGSLGIDELQTSLITGIGAALFHFSNRLSALEGKFSQFEKRFDAMAADVKVIKEDVAFIKYDLKSDIKLIKGKLAI